MAVRKAEQKVEAWVEVMVGSKGACLVGRMVVSTAVTTDDWRVGNSVAS